MKILVIGSGGMLGHITTLYLLEHGYEVFDISKTKKCRKETVLLDVYDKEALSGYLKQNDFDVVINCVALLVRASEANPQAAEELNEKFPHWLEKFYEATSTRIIQVSTAGVFAGDNATYSELDKCDATGCYSKTKQGGELNNQKDLTVRSDFWGPDMNEAASGIFNWIMTVNGEVSGFSNVVINGVSSLEFAYFVELVIRRPMFGIYHLYSGESISKANLLKLVCNSFHREEINVYEVDEPIRNTSLETIREDTEYLNKGYIKQLEDLKEWIEHHKELYPHYSF